jgi:hypothetical protein
MERRYTQKHRGRTITEGRRIDKENSYITIPVPPGETIRRSNIKEI